MVVKYFFIFFVMQIEVWHASCLQEKHSSQKQFVMKQILGVGSRVRHSEIGDGVVINVKS